jgi:hypothetical protein
MLLTALAAGAAAAASLIGLLVCWCIEASSGTDVALVVLLLLDAQLSRKFSAASPTSDTSIAGLQLTTWLFVSPAAAFTASAAAFTASASAAAAGFFAGVPAFIAAALCAVGLQLPLRLLLVLLATLEPNSRLLVPTRLLSWTL